MSKRILSSLLICGLLSGCVTEVYNPPPRAKQAHGSYYHKNGNGNFCPPGQAKKGRC